MGLMREYTQASANSASAEGRTRELSGFFRPAGMADQYISWLCCWKNIRKSRGFNPLRIPGEHETVLNLIKYTG
jgi:hypothetical protein